jgi:hypothetical protein
MSVAGVTAENMCSFRVFRLLTQLRHGVPHVFGADSQHSISGGRGHGWTIPLVVIGQNLMLQWRSGFLSPIKVLV